MQPSKWPLLTIGCAIISMILVGVGTKQLRTAQTEYVGWANLQDRLEQDIRSYLAYESRRADTLFQAQPKADFEQRVREVVLASGISPAPRYTVSVQLDEELRDRQGRATGLRTQRASVQISGLTPAQIGIVLEEWDQSQEVWVPISISLTHDARSDQSRYTIRMDCFAKFHEQRSNRDPIRIANCNAIHSVRLS